MNGYNQGLQNIVSGIQSYARGAEQENERKRLSEQQNQQMQMTKRQRAMQYSQAGLDPNQAMAVAEYEQTGEITPEAQSGLQSFSDYARRRRELEEQALRQKATPKPKEPKLSEAQKTFEREVGKDLAEYQIGGGKQEASKNIQRFESAIKKLEAPGELTGGTLTKIPFLGTSEGFQDIMDEDLSSVRDEIRSAIQGSLRPVLGAQFTEKEAEQIFSRAFNPRLSDKENIRRARLELENIKNIASAKDQAWEYYQQKGSLAGFSPKSKPMESNQMYANNQAQNIPEGQGVLLPGVEQIPTNVPMQNQIIPSATAAPQMNFLDIFKTPEGMSAIEAEKRRRGLK